MSASVILQKAAFDPAEQLAEFGTEPGEGAIVSFTGHARHRNERGEALTALVLETYRGVTLASMKAIAADALVKFPITRCRVIHRAGVIAPGDAIVFVAAAAVHRRAAFAAADYLMDRLKSEAVFWKREEGPGGSRWIEPSAQDLADLARWQQGGR